MKPWVFGCGAVVVVAVGCGSRTGDDLFPVGAGSAIGASDGVGAGGRAAGGAGGRATGGAGGRATGGAGGRAAGGGVSVGGGPAGGAGGQVQPGSCVYPDCGTCGGCFDACFCGFAFETGYEQICAEACSGAGGSPGAGAATGAGGDVGAGGALGWSSAEECVAQSRSDCEACACKLCFEPILTCFQDQGCRSIVQCAAETECTGSACREACRDVIDAFGGSGSPSVDGAASLLKCLSAGGCPCALSQAGL